MITSHKFLPPAVIVPQSCAFSTASVMSAGAVSVLLAYFHQGEYAVSNVPFVTRFVLMPPAPAPPELVLMPPAPAPPELMPPAPAPPVLTPPAPAPPFIPAPPLETPPLPAPPFGAPPMPAPALCADARLGQRPRATTNEQPARLRGKEVATETRREAEEVIGCAAMMPGPWAKDEPRFEKWRAVGEYWQCARILSWHG